MTNHQDARKLLVYSKVARAEMLIIASEIIKEKNKKIEDLENERKNEK